MLVLTAAITCALTSGRASASLIADRSEELSVLSERNPNPSLFTSFHDVNNGTIGEVLVTVQDSGIGIDMENLSGCSTPSSPPRRAALEWAVDRPFDPRGSNLFVSPNADHGATFQFTLPSSSQGVS
jgi:hypothetical protein